MRTRTMPALLAVAALALTACGEDEPAAPVTETVTATPEAADAEESAPAEESQGDEEWLEALHEEHLDGLVEWWNDYYGAGCDDPASGECYEIFNEGAPLVADYSEALRNDTDKPGFVASDYGMRVSHANITMENWQAACPDASNCEDYAEDAHERIAEVVAEALRWSD